MEQEKKSIPFNFSDVLPLGYLYLLVLGIASDSIYYSLLGINIISYSTILDVLLSPVSQMADNKIVFFFIVGMPAFGYIYVLLLRRLAQRLAARKAANENKPNIMTTLSLMQMWLIFTAFVIFSAYIGLGVGKGLKMKERMESGDLPPRQLLTLQNGKSIEVRIMGNNSSYIFYVAKGAKSITIVPIQDNITKIEMIIDEE